MKYKTLHQTARQIDHLIDRYIDSKGTSFIGQDELKKLILKDFSGLYVKDIGWHKIAFGIHSINQKSCLKLDPKTALRKTTEPTSEFQKTSGINCLPRYFGTPNIAYCSSMGPPQT